jgi:hypothetical protein
MSHKPSRSSVFLTGLATLLLVVSAGFGLFILGGALFGFGEGGDDVGVHAVVPVDRVADLPAGTISPDEIEIVVRIRDASVEQLRWFAVRDLPGGLVLIAILWLVRGLLKSVRDGDPFINANVNRLRALAAVVLVGIPLAEFLKSVFAGELAATAGLIGPPTQLSLPSYVLLGGLAILVLSEVFAEGIRLRDDLAGTV